MLISDTSSQRQHRKGPKSKSTGGTSIYWFPTATQAMRLFAVLFVVALAVSGNNPSQHGIIHANHRTLDSCFTGTSNSHVLGTIDFRTGEWSCRQLHTCACKRMQQRPKELVICSQMFPSDSKKIPNPSFLIRINQKMPFEKRKTHPRQKLPTLHIYKPLLWQVKAPPKVSFL